MLWLNHFLQPNQLIHWTENWEIKYNDRVWVKYFLLHFKYIFAWLMWSASAVFSFKWENTHLSPRLMSWKEIDGTAYRMEFRNPKVGWQQFWDPFFSLQQSCSILRIYPTSYQIVWWMTFTFGGRMLEPKCCGKVYVDEARMENGFRCRARVNGRQNISRDGKIWRKQSDMKTTYDKVSHKNWETW